VPALLAGIAIQVYKWPHINNFSFCFVMKNGEQNGK
jgi:hypothetical protein